MNTSGDRVAGVCCFSLVQRRFAAGRLYICQICSANEVVAIDVRYFVEDGSALKPTRQGFRIHRPELLGFISALAKDATELAEVTLWEGNTRKLIAHYCNDEYGEAVDFRYFKTSDTYSGWEKRGIRLKPEDYKKLQQRVLGKNLLDIAVGMESDVLVGKTILSSGTSDTSTGKGGATAPKSSKVIPSEINSALREFIGEL